MRRSVFCGRRRHGRDCCRLAAEVDGPKLNITPDQREAVTRLGALASHVIGGFPHETDETHGWRSMTAATSAPPRPRTISASVSTVRLGSYLRQNALALGEHGQFDFGERDHARPPSRYLPRSAVTIRGTAWGAKVFNAFSHANSRQDCVSITAKRPNTPAISAANS